MTEFDAFAEGPEPPEPDPPGPGVPLAPAVSELHLIGGRLLTGVGMLMGISVIAWQGLNGVIDRNLHPKPRKAVAAWQVGAEADVEITVITPDAKRLQCAHDQTIEDLHCGYTANKRAWRRTANAPLDDNDEHVIQPYRTADSNALVLVSGLWAQPEVALRLHREPPNVADLDKNLRFVAYCRVRFVGELEKVSLRWDTNGKWGDEPKALVAQPLRCTLEPPSG